MQPFISHLKQGVPLVDVGTMRSLINKVGIETFLTELSVRLEQDFARWQQFDKSARYASHSESGVIELMPISDGEFFSCKYVNGHPKNTHVGLQTVAAFAVLADVDTGYPILLCEMCLLTALRTAATSALVAKYLAPKNTRTLALIGNGAQSEFQALAFKALLGVTHIRLFDIDVNASHKVKKNLADSGLTVDICSSATEAIKGAQVITTCTADKCNATILTSDMVGDGVHINAIGGDCPGKTELDADLLKRAQVFVEYEPQTRIEGDIQQLEETFAVTEFHQLVNGKVHGRVDEQQLTIFDGVGFALEDFSALNYVNELIGKQASTRLDLITQQDDPRDLFSVLQANPAVQVAV
ncbi:MULTISPECIES: ornithine cyclodeaminase [Pseudoalteromonas]|uniref:Ornithine cyclodeaminase n=1 Tax=Pseudoalteromonas amylolytica TaxID=1859457 RepID=A0A1S1MZH0_9GAMM|nr:MULTISPECIES: ornithine cyclodeaminase [Pseudoalteromonas]OHU90200.1 ornithine cyclodeaminase [Pseudoalteromonas sp. JW3]OHU92433.1 ornithine cyclodeaminase [Pseudoalteromonas amylolytica]